MERVYSHLMFKQEVKTLEWSKMGSLGGGEELRGV